MKKKMYFPVGLILGTALCMAGSVSAAEDIRAVSERITVCVDGKETEVTVYSVQGESCIRFADMEEITGFAITWDEEGHKVLMSAPASCKPEPTSPVPVKADRNLSGFSGLEPADAAGETVPLASAGGFRISDRAWSRDDFSQKANLDVFSPVFTVELYNALRQTLEDAGNQDEDYMYAYTMIPSSNRSEVKRAINRLDGVYRLKQHVPSTLLNYYEYLDYYAVNAEQPDIVRDCLALCEPVIREINARKSDYDKVSFINDYLCRRIVYDVDATAGLPAVFGSGEPVKGRCANYAYAASFLCSAAGIPCMSICSEDHSWNLVYVDGKWRHLDITHNDLGGRIFLEETVPARIDTAPDATEFLKELLVPGSTK